MPDSTLAPPWGYLEHADAGITYALEDGGITLGRGGPGVDVAVAGTAAAPGVRARVVVDGDRAFLTDAAAGCVVNDARVHAAVELVTGDAIRLHATDAPLRFWFAADFDARRRADRRLSPDVTVTLGGGGGDAAHAASAAPAAGAAPPRADAVLLLGRGPMGERRRSLSGDRRARLREQRSDAVAASLRDVASGAARAATAAELRWRGDGGIGDDDGGLAARVAAAVAAAARARPAGVASVRDDVDAGSWLQVAAARRGRVVRTLSPARAVSRGRGGAAPHDESPLPQQQQQQQQQQRIPIVVSTRRPVPVTADGPARPYLDVNPPPWRGAGRRAVAHEPPGGGGDGGGGASMEVLPAHGFDVPVTVVVPQGRPPPPPPATAVDHVVPAASATRTRAPPPQAAVHGQLGSTGSGSRRRSPETRSAAAAAVAPPPAPRAALGSPDTDLGVPTADQLAAELWGAAPAESDGTSPPASPVRADGRRRAVAVTPGSDGGGDARDGGGGGDGVAAAARADSSSTQPLPRGRSNTDASSMASQRSGAEGRSPHRAAGGVATALAPASAAAPRASAAPHNPSDALAAAVAEQRALGEQLAHVASLLTATLRGGGGGSRGSRDSSNGAEAQSRDGGGDGGESSPRALAPQHERRHVRRRRAIPTTTMTAAAAGHRRRSRSGDGGDGGDGGGSAGSHCAAGSDDDGDDSAGVPSSALRALLRTRDAQARMLLRSADGEICRLAGSARGRAWTPPSLPPVVIGAGQGGGAPQLPPSPQPVLEGTAASSEASSAGPAISARDVTTAASPAPAERDAGSTGTRFRALLQHTGASPCVGSAGEGGDRQPTGQRKLHAATSPRADVGGGDDVGATPPATSRAGRPRGAAASLVTTATARTTLRVGGGTPSEAYRFAALQGVTYSGGASMTSRNGGWSTPRGGGGGVSTLLEWAAAARPPVLAHMPLLPQPL